MGLGKKDLDVEKDLVGALIDQVLCRRCGLCHAVAAASDSKGLLACFGTSSFSVNQLLGYTKHSHRTCSAKRTLTFFWPPCTAQLLCTFCNATVCLQYVLEVAPQEPAAPHVPAKQAGKKRTAADVDDASQDENAAPRPATKASTGKAAKPAKQPAPKVGSDQASACFQCSALANHTTHCMPSASAAVVQWSAAAKACCQHAGTDSWRLLGRLCLAHKRQADRPGSTHCLNHLLCAQYHQLNAQTCLRILPVCRSARRLQAVTMRVQQVAQMRQRTQRTRSPRGAARQPAKAAAQHHQQTPRSRSCRPSAGKLASKSHQTYMSRYASSGLAAADLSCVLILSSLLYYISEHVLQTISQAHARTAQQTPYNKHALVFVSAEQGPCLVAAGTAAAAERPGAQ